MAKICIPLVFLLWDIALTLAMRGYVLTGPKSLLSNSVETFCVSIEGSYTIANCTLDLMAREGDEVYASSSRRIKDPKDCIKLLVPVTGESIARLRWRMRFENLANYTVDSMKEVALRQPETIHLIQTDKAWYTPGQLVRFRILSLNHILFPILDLVKRVWVEDPTGATIVQWTNLTTAHGIHQLELQLSVEPVQGVWKIQMERESHERGVQYFEVREYVLPKFEVNINAPSFIAYNTERDQSVQKIQISICAKYSYGQPVRGNVRANIKVKSDSRYSHRRYFMTPMPVIDFDRTGALNGDTGCYILKLPGDQIGISTYSGSIQKSLQVLAVVTEQGTGIEMNSTWSTEIQRQTMSIDIATWSSSTFKSGLPYYGKVKVTTADNQPAVGTAVEICANPTIVRDENEYDKKEKNQQKPNGKRPSVSDAPKYCSLREADANGFVSFELLPSEPDITEYNIKATVPSPRRSRRAIGPQLDVITEAQLNIRSLYSPSKNFMVFVPPPNYPKAVACLSVLPIKLYFTADKDINFNVHYVVMARGDVMHTGVKQVKFREEDNIDLSLGETLLNKRDNGGSELDSDVEASLKPVGDLEFEIEILPEFAPKISLLAYYVRDDREMVTAHIDIPIENCFPNPVKLSWSSTRKQPGQNVTMNLKGTAGSICGYSVVDRSVTYARPDLQLSESKIYNRLPDLHIPAGSSPQQVTPDWKYCEKKNGESDFDDLRRRKRSYFIGHFSAQFKDAMEAFDNAGILVMSDLNIETRPCREVSRIFPMYLMRRGGMDPRFKSARVSAESMPAESRTFFSATEDVNSYDSVVDLQSAVSVRSYFPETWLWDLVTLNSKGEFGKAVTLPHTITTWVGRALCVSESHGFGMTAAVDIEAFQPFFVEVHLPYSVKRTEKLQLKISVFNYAPHSLPIRLTLAYSEQFELISDSDSTLLCVPARNNVVHHFVIHAIEIGKHNVSVSATIDDNFPGECGPEILPSATDNVIKELLVIPEGFPVERIYSHMACPKDFDEDKALIWDLSLPEDLVEGSARAWVTAVGDLMGPALQGLSGLVRFPTGCGEQNMILFTPNIYVTQYLEATNQLEPAFKAKAVNFMKSGYQRELTYRHHDGSYSAFGKNDPQGSLWLTAFVVKSFAASRRYIHIDDNELQTSVRWLQSKQLENGCFPVVGTVLHADLKGGLAESEENLAPLTAFTLISLLEMHSEDSKTTERKKTMLAVKKLLDNTLPCLESEESEMTDVYTRALTAYALTLADRSESARRHIDWLMAHAQNNNSLLWWQKPGSGPALNVEMTSYVLLSLVKLGTNQDLLQARSIVRWLSKQRNSEGGFVSTQDTVVALQAIAAYASVIGAQSVDMEILVTAGVYENYVRIRELDRLVQRRIDLPSPLATEVHIDTVGEGSGCAVLQATLRYNVRTAPPAALFHLNVSTAQETGGGGEKCRHQLVVCSRYLGSKNQESNMALIEIGFVSGYEVDKVSLNKNTLPGVKRHDVTGDTVVLYFDQITSQTDVCVSLVAQHVYQVDDAKEANVKIYDYYQPEHSKIVSYNLPNGCSLSEVKPMVAVPLADAMTLSLPRPLLVSRKGVQTDDTLSAADTVIVEPIPTKEVVSEPRGLLGHSTVDGMRNNSRIARMNDAEDVDVGKSPRRANFDLDVSDRGEGPVPVFSPPGHLRGCPRCALGLPGDFPSLYCQSKTVYLAETRPSRGQRLRLVNDISSQHLKPVKMNSSIDLLLEPNCECHFFKPDATNRSVVVLGLPVTSLPSSPAKLAVGLELLIIDSNPKQINIKSIRSKCGRMGP